MLAMQTLFVALFLLVSFGETLTQKESKNVRTKHLFVQRKGPRRGSSLPSQEIHLPENGDGSAKLSQEHSRRSRRSTRQRRSASKDPTHTVHRFNDNHYMLYVHWTGIAKSKTVVVLSRDIRQTSTSTSYLYVSNNYGVNYKNQSHKLTYSNNKQGLIDKFYTSPNNETWYIFADTTNKGIFTSKTDCETFTSNMVGFKPSDITFHGSKHNGILAYDDETKILYYSNDFGATWNEREKKVKSYYWGIDKLDSNDTVYIEIDNGNGTSSVIRGHWNHKHYTGHIIRSNVIDFEINDGYMFQTQKGKNGNLDLYVSYHFHDRVMAKFPNELKRKDYFIADASEGQVFVAVNHNKNTSHLYISDTRGEHYTLSMERVLFYSPNRTEDIWLRRYSQEEFVDIHPVASIRGIYVASQLNSDGKITTKISFDKGRSWKKVNAPIRHANGSLVQCVTQGTSCSLHLALLYAKIHPWYFAPSIKSRKSAPGLIVSSGNIGQTLNRHANLYVSNNAGESWLEVLQGRWYFNFGDHGGIIVAVRQWSPTKELRYSTDEGLTWKKFQFTNTSVHVYGVLTEPGETTTIFTIFGSYGGAHSWIVIQVNTSNVLGRPCTNADYETWTPYHRGHGYGCILGQRLDYERRKRNSTCYNGHNYDRPIKTSICSCSDQDYECDSGFIPRGYVCNVDPNAGFYPHAPPRPCPYGTTYNDSQGYRKIAGDKCSGGDSAWWYEPRQVSCPFKLDPAFLLYAERTTIQYVDLTNNNRSTPIQGLRGAVAVAYDRNDDYIYWADIKTHMIYGRGFQKQEIKAIAGVKQVEGLDFDWTTQNLYWVDSAKKVIEVCRKDGLYRKTVHIDKLDKPRALALDPPMGEMFWTDWGQKPKIEMSDMDGKNRVILVDSDIVWPNGLAIDIYNRKSSRILYYTDAKLDKIGSYNMHTKKKKVLASRSDHKDQWGSILLHPYSIAVDDVYVYWDDWQSGKVFKIHKSFTGKVETLVNRNTDLPAKSRYEIKVYYSGSQVGTSACTHKHCPQLCLPKPNKKYVCECADDLVLDPKTNECKCIGGLITLKNGTCKRPSGSTCAPHEFACNNGYCISQEGRCDWYDDCGDSSDERGCGDVKHCDDGEYACIGGKCISRERLCDGLKDCPTGDDEKDCVDCQEDQLRCDDGICIPNDAVCDGQQDCEDNSDEKYCNHECDRQYQFECHDLKQCINASLRCDRHPDCNDGSDEKNCDGYCLPRFKCNDGIGCIDPKKQCDNVTDCSDGSDELCHMSQGGGVAKKIVAQKSSSKKTLMWAIPVGIVFVVLLGALAYFMVKSRRLQRSFYHLVRSDSFDQGVTYHNAGDDDDTPLIQGFSDDDPLVEA